MGFLGEQARPRLLECLLETWPQDPKNLERVFQESAFPSLYRGTGRPRLGWFECRATSTPLVYCQQPSPHLSWALKAPKKFSMQQRAHLGALNEVDSSLLRFPLGWPRLEGGGSEKRLEGRGR